NPAVVRRNNQHMVEAAQAHLAALLNFPPDSGLLEIVSRHARGSLDKIALPAVPGSVERDLVRIDLQTLDRRCNGVLRRLHGGCVFRHGINSSMLRFSPSDQS